MSRTVTLSAPNFGDEKALLPFLHEESTSAGNFTQLIGPFSSYDRHRGTNGDWIVRYTLDTYGLNWLFNPVYRRLLGGSSGLITRLIPPQPISRDSLRLISLMFWVTAVIAYCGTLLGQTLAFAAPTLHAGALAQTLSLGGTRIDVLFALGLARHADQRGRSRVLNWALLLAIGGTVLAALSANIVMLTICEIIAKAGATTATLLIAVVITESVEQNARAWSLAFLVIGTSIGTGLCAILVAGLSLNQQSWRILYLLALLGTPILFTLRRLPDTTRFLSHPQPLAFRELRSKRHRGRLILICLAAAMINIFYIPQSQLRNQFLRFDQHLPSWQISLFTIGTNLPGAIGLAAGSRQAEVRGRRFIAAFGLAGGGLLLGLAFLSSGTPLFIFSALGAMVGTAAVPAMAVFGPELFPTRLRSGANAVATVASRVGSVVGLIAVGIAASNGAGYGAPIATLAIFPIGLALIVWRRFPETKGETLEDINPEDRT
ncbi:MAG: MFS transporter [Ferrimicrobium sp.]|jgi:MFS family permease|uniref:MFS transporter n=1 Tax=Ferrimicrobium acidiphilum TaxID=121039 RepID=A0ABV3XY67_9ACTN|nr:MFS transporter [Ferrimicrobium sp.]MCL5973196.1 MFS transporter [Actinomycetota bacterium]